ncbi:MAG TPA: hypothetical protein P5089_00330 [Candidatus Portnoybacteria bacterium]|nr:hypothetical protein [Candidatus Portnoybacteria bacterium]
MVDEDKEIKKRIKQFQADIFNKAISSQEMVWRYIVFDQPFIFRDSQDLFFEFKKEIARHYNIRPSCVNIAGSSKLGFSISPEKIWKHITADSDIDAVIIDPYLFDEYWKKILEYYNPDNITPLTQEENDNYSEIRKYFFKGRLRLDLVKPGIPGMESYIEITKKTYNKYDNRKVSIGFFRSEDLFEHYHVLNINNIRKKYGE